MVICKGQRTNVKSFGTGISVADYRVFSALEDGVELPFIFIIPKDREGLVSNQDWDNIGQRRTDSSSYTFNNVLVEKDENFRAIQSS